MSDPILSIKAGFGLYMGRFFAGLYPDTPAMQEYTARELARAIQWAPAKMVDQVEKMLQAYQKNANSTQAAPYTPGKNALFPTIIVAMAKDYTPSGADFAGRQVHRQLVTLEAKDGASVYGYRQGMGDVRVQVVIMAAETATAQSLAAQFSLFLGEIPNRRFTAQYHWGQYTLEMPVVIESPDILFSKIDPENEGMTVLVADITLKATLPYLDAPKDGELNDGTTNDPPGWPTVEQIRQVNEVTQDIRVIEIETP